MLIPLSIGIKTKEMSIEKVRISQLPVAADNEITDDMWMVFNTSTGQTKRKQFGSIKSLTGCDSHCMQVEMQPADVKQMNSVPYEILPALPLGSYYVFEDAFLFSEFNTTPYATFIQLEIQGAAGESITMSSNCLGFAADVEGQRLPLADDTLTNQFCNSSVRVTNATGDPSAGDSIIRIVFKYRIITL